MLCDQTFGEVRHNLDKVAGGNPLKNFWRGRQGELRALRD